jgi:glutathione S-transferase
MPEIELYSATLCPYAHRSRLTLLEKGISFKLSEIDLQNKPENFRDISPTGKVPVLKHGENRVWESTIINEYLNEVFPTPALMPQSPAERAQARIWMKFADTHLFAVAHKLLFSSDQQQQMKVKKELTENLQWIESEGLQKHSEGSYWFGAKVSLVDLTYYPWFEQLVVLEHFRGFQFPAELERIQKWQEAVASRESVRAIAQSRDFYLRQYAQIMSAMAQS